MKEKTFPSFFRRLMMTRERTSMRKCVIKFELNSLSPLSLAADDKIENKIEHVIVVREDYEGRKLP